MIRIPTIPASLLALAALLAAPAAFAICDYPHSPAQFPDGNTAKLEEMVTAQQSVKQYMGEMDTYLKCIDEENPPAAAGTTLTDDQKKAQDARERVRAQKHNAAVTDMESVAERFNVQLRIFRAKSAEG